MYSARPEIYYNRWYSHEAQLTESSIGSSHMLGQNGLDHERSHRFSDWNKFDLCTYPTNSGRNSDPNKRQFLPPVSSVCNLCSARLFGPRDVNANIGLQQNFNGNIDSREVEYANNMFCSGIRNTSGINNGGNLTSDQDRENLWSNFGDSLEIDDDDSVRIIDEIWYTPREISSTPVVLSQSMPVSSLPENDKYVSVIRHTNSLGKSHHKTPNSNIVIDDVACTGPMDCNNNSNNTAKVPKYQENKKPTLLPLKGKIVALNHLKGLQKSEIFKQEFSLFHGPYNFKITKKCGIIKPNHISKTENVMKSIAFPLVLAFPFHTFQISVDTYFLFLNVSSHHHIFFNSVLSCLMYLSVISKLSHFLFKQTANSNELCFAGKPEEKCVESWKPEGFPLNISSILSDHQFLKSRELFTVKDVLFFRKSQNDSFIPLKICGVSPCTLNRSVSEEAKIPKTLQASNGSTIPVVLFKQQICSKFSEIELEKVLFEIIQSLKTHHLFKSSANDKVLVEKNVFHNTEKDRRAGDTVFVKHKSGKPREKTNRKIGMYIVKPMSIRRAHFAKNRNLFSVRPAWVDSDLKLYFEKLNFDNGNLLNKSKYGIFEIKPITNCTDNLAQVIDEPYKVKYLLRDKSIKISLIKEQTTKAGKKSRNRIDDITNQNSSVVNVFDNLSDMDKKNTLLLMKNDSGYENVGQEPIQIILQKLDIQGYPFLIDETPENLSEPVLKPFRSSLSNPAFNQDVEPLASICQDIERALNSSESISSIDTCRILADTFRKHKNSEKQKFGCMRKILSDSEKKDLLKESYGKGNTCFNVYEAVLKYLCVNCKGIGEFKNCIEFRHTEAVQSLVPQANFARSDDNLFLFYDVLMSDGQSMITLQVVINRRLPTEKPCVKSVGFHLESGEENCVNEEFISSKLQNELSFPSKRITSQEMELELELAMIHGEAPSNNLPTQLLNEKTGIQENSLCHAVEDKPLNNRKIGLSGLKAAENDPVSNQLISETKINPFAANEILQTNRHVAESNTGSSDTGKNLDFSEQSATKAYNNGLERKMSVHFSNFSLSKLSHHSFEDRCYSPPLKKPRHTYEDRKKRKERTISIKQYIERNPFRENEAVDASYKSENLFFMPKRNSVSPSSHIADHPRELGKSKAYERNQQSIEFQHSDELKNRKLLYSGDYHLQSGDVCLQHQTSSHFSQCYPSFEIGKSHQGIHKRRCRESDSLKIDHDHWQYLVLDKSVPSSLIGGSICKHCEKSFNRHSFRDGVYKCPKRRMCSIKMCHENTWKKSCNVMRLSSENETVKQNNRKTRSDITVKKRNNIRIYTDPECFKNIEASTLTREDEDALEKVVSEGDIFLYSPERKRTTQDPRFRKRTPAMDLVESNNYKNEITGCINTKFNSKSDIPCAAECDLKAFTEVCEKEVIDSSLKSVQTKNENAMKFNEKCLIFLKTQAMYCSANPGGELSPLLHENLEKQNKIKIDHNSKNCCEWQRQLDLTDSDLVLGALQPASCQGPGKH
ncbi:Asparagine--tRNA ligase [Frankliniella fusca]|uniref:Asparagine--tRNA ligase n=1 Tax=Frankliniella fusca TaxID=407009 RepID=A0AAE1HIB9_9NEOP|nr:Asparagine--tRNA ligase [Frankliniella fusca]